MTFNSLLNGWPVGIWVIGNDVITACDQSLIDAGKEGIGLWRAKDSLEGCDANLSHALCAALQKERQQRAHNLGGIQLLCTEEISTVGLGMEAYQDLSALFDLILFFNNVGKNHSHNEITRETNQRQEDVFKRRGQRQRLTTQCPKMSCLDGTDVALWWNCIIGKCISLRKEKTEKSYNSKLQNQSHALKKLL